MEQEKLVIKDEEKENLPRIVINGEVFKIVSLPSGLLIPVKE